MKKHRNQTVSTQFSSQREKPDQKILKKTNWQTKNIQNTLRLPTKTVGIKQSLSHTIEFSKNTHPPTPPTTTAGELQRALLKFFGVRHPLRGNSPSLPDPVPGRKPGHPGRAGRTCSAHPQPRCTNLCTPEPNQGGHRESKTRSRKPLTRTFILARLPGACPRRSDSKKVTRS